MDTALEVNNPEEEETPRRGLAKAATPRAALAVADSTTDLLKVAIEHGATPEQLTSLVELHERMETRQARREFFAALVAFQQEVPAITRERTAKIATKSGGSYSFQYAELGDIAKAIGPYLVKHGLAYKWDADESNEKMVRVTCTVMHIAGHSEKSSFAVPTESASGMSAQQKNGAALTYAQRRCLSIALGLTTTDDEPDAVDPTPISEDQATQLQDLIDDKGINLARFLKYMGAETLGQIRAADYQKALTALQQAKGR